MTSRSKEHTPGPWEQGYELVREPGHIGGYESGAIRASNSGEDIAVCCGKEKGRANARRIVACVNACEGVSTSALETLIKDVGAISFGKVEAERDRLSALNAELVEALENLNHMGGDERGGYCICPRNDGSASDHKHATNCANARAVLAKVREGA